MTETARIADQIKRSVYGDAWHGYALLELLNDVTAERAAARPIAGAHTIHEIVLHVMTWLNLSFRALRGEPIPEWPFPEDWPPTEGVERTGTVARLKHSTDELVNAVTDFNEEGLARIVPGRDFDAYFLLHGIAQHNTYHGGQIALIKKAAGL